MSIRVWPAAETGLETAWNSEKPKFCIGIFCRSGSFHQLGSGLQTNRRGRQGTSADPDRLNLQSRWPTLCLHGITADFIPGLCLIRNTS
ncbi:MAG TPA: hypothetical protein DC058_01450 [Planctomycetaceae bacterium]|nr:hypothetical protein [Planctomycetaceae bacterium]